MANPSEEIPLPPQDVLVAPESVASPTDASHASLDPAAMAAATAASAAYIYPQYTVPYVNTYPTQAYAGYAAAPYSYYPYAAQQIIAGQTVASSQTSHSANSQPTSKSVSHVKPEQVNEEEDGCDEDDYDDDPTIDRNQKPTKANNVLPIWGNEKTMNLNSLILTNIQQSPYFKVNLFKLKTYHEVIDEIYYQVRHLEPWERGSRKVAGQTGMCGSVRGVGAGGIVSTPFCILYKLYTLRLTRKQLVGMLNHQDSPYIRAMGFMYIRYTQPPNTFWQWYEPYFEDQEEIEVKSGVVITMGELVRQLITKLEWYATLFPRMPIPVQKNIEKKLEEYDRNKRNPKKKKESKQSDEYLEDGEVSEPEEEERDNHNRHQRSRSRECGSIRHTNGRSSHHRSPDSVRSRYRSRSPSLDRERKDRNRNRDRDESRNAKNRRRSRSRSRDRHHHHNRHDYDSKKRSR